MCMSRGSWGTVSKGSVDLLPKRGPGDLGPWETARDSGAGPFNKQRWKKIKRDPHFTLREPHKANCPQCDAEAKMSANLTALKKL